TSFQAMPHPMMKVPALGANAFVTIKRTEFNAGKYAPYVGDEVRIDIAIEALAK
ncbi:MAG: YceI family protein, partial [Betaproteobacteria bacterium]|nr:YceI family protein [Betaproteobacteria bacterium]